MKLLLYLFFLTLTVPVQTHIVSLFPFRFPLDLILIVTYYHGYFHGKTKGMVVGAYLGILTDILSGELLGTQMFLKTLIGYLSAVLGLGVLSKELPTHLLLISLFSLLNGVVNLLLVNLFGGPVSLPDALWVMILPSIAWNAFVGLLFISFILKRDLKQQVLPDENS